MTTLVIAPGDAPPLLGRESAIALGVLQVGPQDINFTPCSDIRADIIKKYPGINQGIGRLRDFEVKLYIDKTVTPVARKHNRVPFHLRDKVEREIQRLLKEDIIEEVTGPTDWISSVVTPPKPKNPDEIRLCVDMREANKAIKRTRHVTPTLEELIADMSGATVFSKLDLRSGYHQLVLDPESRNITTFSTHVGLFRYKRLIFGVNSAAEVFQHTIQTVIAGIKGSRNISDDIIIYGKGDEDHDRALYSTLDRLHQAGLTVNIEKCQFKQPTVEFYSHVFGPDGLSPDPEKVAALKDTPEPKSAAEVRSFLGMAQYSARFIPDFATMTSDLRSLTKKDAPWEWSERHMKSFQAVKDALSETATNSYFDPKKPIVIHVDASPVGLAAVLSQEGKPVAYASRALTPTEQRYSQTEREALAVVWGCEHFNIFVNGAKFKVVTDHMPLIGIWKKAIHHQVRLARWALRLSTYDVELVYEPGHSNPADYMSRHPTSTTKVSSEEKLAEEYVHFVATMATPIALTIQDVQIATKDDPTLQVVIDLVRTGQWHNIEAYEMSRDVNYSELLTYRTVQAELAVAGSDDIVLRDHRIVIPKSLQQRAVDLAHEGHQGISKTKGLMRTKVWFPGMDKLIKTIQKCIVCQVNTTCTTKEPLAMSELPRGPWLNLSMDFCGPLPTGEYLLVITDEYSRYPVVEIVRSTSAESTIAVMEKTFAAYGYPEVVKSDNGPPFSSHAWKLYLTTCGVRHRRITPRWPQAKPKQRASTNH